MFSSDLRYSRGVLGLKLIDLLPGNLLLITLFFFEFIQAIL